MGLILRPDGSREERVPANGQFYELEEMQRIVAEGSDEERGLIEIISTKDNRLMILNEEGKLIGLPRNEQATALAALATPADIAMLRLMIGDRLIYVGSDLEEEEADWIAGTVLVCEHSEVR